MTMLKKRKFPRIGENWQLKFRVIEKQVMQGSPLDSMALNVSGGGVCFSSRQEVKPGSMLALEIQTPGFDMPMIAMAKAVWCKKHRLDDVFELGCEFWWVGWKDNTAQEALADYIKKQTQECNNETGAVDIR